MYIYIYYPRICMCIHVFVDIHMIFLYRVSQYTWDPCDC